MNTYYCNSEWFNGQMYGDNMKEIADRMVLMYFEIFLKRETRIELKMVITLSSRQCSNI